MSLINSEIKNLILKNLSCIINYSDSNWDHISLDLKLKIIHHYCNFFNNKNNNNDIDINKICIKNMKPKQFIQLFDINKKNNNAIYESYKLEILEYTRKFRIITKNKNYITFSNLPKKIYDDILNNYTNIIYSFILNNKKKINVTNFYYKLLGKNVDKVISLDKKFSITNLSIDNNKIIIELNKLISINLELFYSCLKISNNIPVKFKIHLLNYI